MANNGRRKVWRLGSAGAALVVALLIVMQTSSSARVYIRIAPPVPIVEVAPPPPGPDYFWVPGFWIWDGAHYVWRHSHLCPSSTSRRGLGARTLGPSRQRLVLDPWPLATLRRIGVLWFFSRRSSQDVPNCEQDAVTANVNLEVKNRELSSMLEEAARSDRLVAEERLQGGKNC